MKKSQQSTPLPEEDSGKQLQEDLERIYGKEEEKEEAPCSSSASRSASSKEC